MKNFSLGLQYFFYARSNRLLSLSLSLSLSLCNVCNNLRELKDFKRFLDITQVHLQTKNSLSPLVAVTDIFVHENDNPIWDYRGRHCGPVQ